MTKWKYLVDLKMQGSGSTKDESFEQLYRFVKMDISVITIKILKAFDA